MRNPFRRRRATTDAPLIRSRSESRIVAGPTVDVTLKPELGDFLGRFAYLELAAFESLADTVRGAPGIVEKRAVAAAAGQALTTHQRLAGEIETSGGEPSALMSACAPDVDRFREAIAGGTWHEAVLSCYLADGVITDVAAALAAGLPRGYRERVTDTLADGDRSAMLVETLRSGLAADPGQAPRLALWGRRIVGEVLLQARAALRPATGTGDFEATIAPILTELIAAHTRRMYGLGLTA
ncbi:MAG: ferritin-like fold-containing protein [Microbacteriaceae bacterium]